MYVSILNIFLFANNIKMEWKTNNQSIQQANKWTCFQNKGYNEKNELTSNSKTPAIDRSEKTIASRSVGSACVRSWLCDRRLISILDCIE